jgi:hypothetical protein
MSKLNKNQIEAEKVRLASHVDSFYSLAKSSPQMEDAINTLTIILCWTVERLAKERKSEKVAPR